MCCQVDLELWRSAHSARFDFGKKLFRRLALSLSSVYMSLFTSRGGIDDLVHGIMKDFNVDHQSFVLRVFDLSFFAILS